MAIAISCPSCRTAFNVSDSAAGKVGKCRKCGGAISVPKAVPSGKVCADCGIDVGGQKRTKDTAGRYFCQPCWTAKVATGRATVATPASMASGRSTAIASRSSSVAAPPLPLGDEQDNDVAALEDCPICKMSVPADEMVPGDDDQMVCRSCAHQEISLADIPDELPVNENVPYQAAPPPVPAAARNSAPRGAPLQYQPRPKAQMQRSSSSYDRALIYNGIIFTIGVAVTVITYMMAAGHGTFFVAWGAILFGGIRFILALIGKLSGG